MSRSGVAGSWKREHEYTDDLLDIGGEFAMSLATHHGFAGAALAETEGGGSQAAEELERAISLYNAGLAPEKNTGSAESRSQGSTWLPSASVPEGSTLRLRPWSRS